MATKKDHSTSIFVTSEEFDPNYEIQDGHITQ
jgi:hypothetical protein